MSVKTHLSKVKLDRGGYDPRGRYWGTGAPLYQLELEVDGRFEDATHFRASSRDEAKRKVAEELQKRGFEVPAKRAPRGPRAPKASTFDAKLAETLDHRPLIQAAFHPLFDHLVSLARDSHRQAQQTTSTSVREMMSKRSGRELAQARKMATKYPVV